MNQNEFKLKQKYINELVKRGYMEVYLKELTLDNLDFILRQYEYQNNKVNPFEVLHNIVSNYKTQEENDLAEQHSEYSSEIRMAELKMLIDISLKNQDKESFMKLSSELKSLIV